MNSLTPVVRANRFVVLLLAMDGHSRGFREPLAKDSTSPGSPEHDGRHKACALSPAQAGRARASNLKYKRVNTKAWLNDYYFESKGKLKKLNPTARGKGTTSVICLLLASPTPNPLIFKTCSLRGAIISSL